LRLRHRPRTRSADVDPRRAVTRLAQRKRPGQVARHVVVPEGGHEPRAGGRGTRAVLVEHLANELRLARRVDIGRAGADRRLDGRAPPACKRPDGGDQHVAGLEQRTHGVGPGHIGHRRIEPAVKLGRQSLQPLRAASGQHGAGAELHEAPGGQPAGVAGRAKEDYPGGHRGILGVGRFATHWPRDNQAGGFERFT